MFLRTATNISAANNTNFDVEYTSSARSEAQCYNKGIMPAMAKEKICPFFKVCKATLSPEKKLSYPLYVSLCSITSAYSVIIVAYHTGLMRPRIPTPAMKSSPQSSRITSQKGTLSILNILMIFSPLLEQPNIMRAFQKRKKMLLGIVPVELQPLSLAELGMNPPRSLVHLRHRGLLIMRSPN